MHERAHPRRRATTRLQWGYLIAVGAVALISVATLTPSAETGARSWCVPCAIRHRALVGDVIANLVLFVPLGFGLALAGVRPTIVVFGSLAVSVLVEGLQAYVIPGRVANLVDVVTNTTGASLAALAAPRWRSAAFPSPNVCQRLALAALGGLFATIGASGWALSPAVTRGAIVARGVDSRATRARSERVVGVIVDGHRVHSRDTMQLHYSTERPLRVQVELQASPSPWHGEPALRLIGEGQRQIQLGIDEEQLELEVRRKGAELRLLSPSIRLSRRAWAAERAASGSLDTLLLRAVIAPWRMTLTVDAGSTRATRQLRLHPLAGWMLLVRNPRSSVRADAITAVWTAILFFPFAYWMAVATAPRHGRLVTILLGGLGGALLIGVAFRAPPPPVSAVAAAVGASVVAWRLARLTGATKHDNGAESELRAVVAHRPLGPDVG